MSMPEELLALLREASTCYVATLMPDGSPQLTQTWADTDGEHVVINTVQGYQKDRNIQRDNRVTVAVAGREDPFRYFEVRGRVVDVSTDGGAEHIEALSQRYTGGPYAWYGGRDQVRIIVKIAPERVNSMG